MPDISMCQNKDCPLREKCYRYRAYPTPGRQAYMDFKYEDGKCGDFWDTEGYGKEVRPLAVIEKEQA